MFKIKVSVLSWHPRCFDEVSSYVQDQSECANSESDVLFTELARAFEIDHSKNCKNFEKPLPYMNVIINI